MLTSRMGTARENDGFRSYRPIGMGLKRSLNPDIIRTLTRTSFTLNQMKMQGKTIRPSQLPSMAFSQHKLYTEATITKSQSRLGSNAMSYRSHKRTES